MDDSELKRERKEKKKRKREKKEKEAAAEMKRSKEDDDDEPRELTKHDTSTDKKKKKRKRDKDETNGSANGKNQEDKEEDDQHDMKSSKKKSKNKRNGGEEMNSSEVTNTATDEKKKKRQRDEGEAGSPSKPLADEPKASSNSTRNDKEEGQHSTKKKSKKHQPKSALDKDSPIPTTTSATATNGNISSSSSSSNNDHRRPFPVDYQYIVAPMVGASELPFRLLCRTYGAQLCYTPMMSSTQFVHDAAYRQAEFLGQVSPEDRPLVCHFSANDPKDFAQAAQLVEPYCDAIDLNLGCPQRTAYVGHFGSYLLDPVDRALVLQIVAAGAKAVSIPICCKIRLLDTLEETIELCQQLQKAGAGLIAIHARYRASWERTAAGARDGPALLDQVTELRKHVTNIPIVTNGNTITYDDVVKNLELTQADGLMSAEGILDNPALFLPRLGSKEEGDKLITIMDPLAVPTTANLPSPKEQVSSPPPSHQQPQLSDADQKKKKRLTKKLREIERIEEKLHTEGEGSIDQDQKGKLANKAAVEKQLSELDHPSPQCGSTPIVTPDVSRPVTTKVVKLRELYHVAQDKLLLANEYLSLVRRYPTKIRTVIFHTRRMLRSMLEQYQLLEDLLAAATVDEVQGILSKCLEYRDNPQSFEFDRDKAKRQKEALEKRRHEEGKRKAFEARMMRKAKREGKTDLSYYLRQGSQVPTAETIAKMKKMSKEQQLALWKEQDHSQHCLAFHLDPNGCKRDRACAFLHVETKGANAFDESDEVAG